jgi:Prophage tail length tape measure protein
MEDRVLQIVLKARDEASKELEKVSKKAGGLSEMLAGSFKNAAIVSGAALGALVAESIRAIGAFSESEKVMAQTEAVLKSTGGVAGITAQQVTDLSTELQRLTGMSDETIQSGQNLLLTFTNIGKDVFPEATQTMLDMSVALGQDVKNSAIQLGKALQDPILGVTALRRVGVNFSESQQQMIQKLVESGKSLEAQKFILKELQTEFGGSAKAAGETMAGKLEILKNTIGDLEEVLGGFIGKTMGKLIDKVQKFVDDIGPWIKGTEDVSTMTKRLSDDFGGLGLAFGNMVKLFTENKDVLVGTIGAIGGIALLALGPAALAMLGFVIAALPAIAIAGTLGAAAALLVANWDKVTQFFSDTWKSVTERFNQAKEDITKKIDDIKTWFSELPTKVQEYLTDLFFVKIPFAIGYIAGYLSEAIPRIINDMINWFMGLPGKVNKTFDDSKQKMIDRLKEAWEWLSTNVSTWPTKIEDFIKSLPEKIKQVFENAKQAAISKMNEMFDGVKAIFEKIGQIFENIKNGISSIGGNISQGFQAGKDAGIRGYATGGYVPSTGLAYLHQGEFVLSKNMLEGRESSPAVSNFNQPITIGPVYVNDSSDIDLLSQQLAFRLSLR